MSAPSFSSFPISFSSFPDLEQESGPSKLHSTSPPRASKHDKDHDKKREKSKLKSRDKHARDKKKRKFEKRYNEPVAGEQSLHEDVRNHAGDRETRPKTDPFTYDGRPAFYSDRKGDPLNIRYGGLYAGDIPRYRLVDGGRRILGLNYAWIVLHRSGKGIEVGVGGRRKQPALTDSGSRALLAAPPARRLIATGARYQYEEVDGFLRLPSRRGRQTDQPYRAIELSKADDNSDSNSSDSGAQESSDSDDESDTPRLTSQQYTIGSLEERLSEDPASVPTWLSLHSHSLSNIPLTSKNATKTRSEISLAILSRALSAHPSNKASKALLLKYLQAGEEVWHESKLRAEWEDALKVDNVDIWMEWLEWRIRRAVKGLDGVIEDAQRVFSALEGDGENEIGRLRVFWRIAVAFRSAGYIERATALFQAQAALYVVSNLSLVLRLNALATRSTLEMPQDVSGLPFHLQLDALEEFWESEVPRCGERGAKGWAAWVLSGKPDSDVTASTSSAVRVSQDRDPFRKWGDEEIDADRASGIPTRSTDNTDDPYSTVLFTDIRPLLISLSSAQAKKAFRLAWLSVLGLPLPGFSQSLSTGQSYSADERWSSTYLTTAYSLASLFPPVDERRRITSDAAAGALVGREPVYATGSGPVKSWPFSIVHPLEKIGKWQLWSAADIHAMDTQFVRNIFSQLHMVADDWDWESLALAFEAAADMKSAIKMSRNFLAVARDSLSRWRTHARLERLRGRINDARKVYHTVLVASPPPFDKPVVSLLWWDWAEMEWLAGDTDAAASVICKAVNVAGQGGVAILRAKRGVDDALKEVSIFRWEDRHAWIKLRSLLELLTGSIDAALAIFDLHLAMDDSAKPGNLEHESLTLAALSLAYNFRYTLQSPLPPAVLRDRVWSALEAYPSDTIFLGMFLEIEKGQGIWGRVRRLLGDSSLGPDGSVVEKDVTRRIAEVWIAGWERSRWEGEVERVRAGLAAAVNNERTHGSAILWRVYLEFEIRLGQLQRAKSLLYRAIGQCPLFKDLYVLAFTSLRSVFSVRDLGDFADTMAERGLRMRKSLEDVLDNAQNKSDDDEEESDMSDDEIEHNARELRRLQPY